jgi:hypothetical protein
MAANDFLPYATGGGANVEAQGTYAASSVVGSGFLSGIVPSNRFNKILRQAMFGAATLFGFVFDTLGLDVLDDGDIAGKKTLFARAIAQAVAAGGKCRLGKSGANILLTPYQGNKIFIPGTGLMTVPAAGVAMTTATALREGGAMANLTLYYVYAYNNGGTLALQPSATGHQTDATTGTEVCTADSTRALVGMVRLVGGGFVDSGAQRFVASFFNRQNKKLAGGGSGTTASTTFVEIQVAGRMEFLEWADEDVYATAHGSVTNNTTAGVSQAILTADGTATGSGSTTTSPSAASSNPVSSTFSGASLAEGYHYLSLFGNTSTGTSSTFATQLTGMIRS